MDDDIPKTAATIMLYAVLVAATAVTAYESIIFDEAPKNGCRVYLADVYEETRMFRPAPVMVTAHAADVPFGSTTEYHGDRVTKSTVPYPGGNPCDEAVLNEYHTDEYALVSYASTGGPLRWETMQAVVLAIIALVFGWRISRLMVWVATALGSLVSTGAVRPQDGPN